MSDYCPVCTSLLSKSSEEYPRSGDYYYINCDRCGLYRITRSLRNDLLKNEVYKRDIEKIAIVSHTIRKMQGRGEIPLIDSMLFERLLQNSLPSLSDQINNLIIWMGENTSIGKTMHVNNQTDLSVIGAETPDGFTLVLKDLKEQGIFFGSTIEDYTGLQGEIGLSIDGWFLFDEIQKGAITSRKAFMAMKYKDPELDNIVDNFLKSAVLKTGFELYKLSDVSQAGIIDNHLRNEIRTSRFLIADLTHDNEGAYWEAGFAEGLGKHVIYTCEKDKFENEGTHFDTNHCWTIRWDKNKPEEAAEELKATIRATLPDEAKLTDD